MWCGTVGSIQAVRHRWLSCGPKQVEPTFLQTWRLLNSIWSDIIRLWVEERSLDPSLGSFDRLPSDSNNHEETRTVIFCRATCIAAYTTSEDRRADNEDIEMMRVRRVKDRVNKYVSNKLLCCEICAWSWAFYKSTPVGILPWELYEIRVYLWLSDGK